MANTRYQMTSQDRKTQGSKKYQIRQDNQIKCT